MDHNEIRRRILIAMFSDDVLLNYLVVKGGNALELIHQLGARASIDVDFSIQKDFEDLSDVRDRIFRGLQREFREIGLTVFDAEMQEKPSVRREGLPEWWGGYLVTFKLVETDLYEAHQKDLETLRRRSEPADPQMRRKFKIDISKYEYVDPKVAVEFDDYTVYVYTPAMVVLEKVRAICQQMPAYKLISARMKRARARDFYDIHTATHRLGIDLAAVHNHELCRNIFATKQVSLALIPQIEQYREFHRTDWPSVVASALEAVEDFDFYFDSVIGLTEALKPLWDE